MLTLDCPTLEDLETTAQAVLKYCEPNKVLLFKGEMGAGKTTLIKKICTFLGINEAVSSPTYSLVNEYLSESGEKVYHFDLYRINDLEEALDMGIEDYLDSGNFCLIEWPELIEELIPKDHVEIRIATTNEKRVLTLTKPK